MLILQTGEKGFLAPLMISRPCFVTRPRICCRPCFAVWNTAPLFMGLIAGILQGHTGGRTQAKLQGNTWKCHQAKVYFPNIHQISQKKWQLWPSLSSTLQEPQELVSFPSLHYPQCLHLMRTLCVTAPYVLLHTHHCVVAILITSCRAGLIAAGNLILTSETRKNPNIVYVHVCAHKSGDGAQGFQMTWEMKVILPHVGKWSACMHKHESWWL